MADTPIPGTAPVMPATPRLTALQTLGSQVSNQIGTQAGQQQGARVAGLQTAVQGADAGGQRLSAGAIQATGGQQAAQSGAIGLQAATLGQQRLGQIGAMGLQEQFMGNQQELANRKLQLDKDSQATTDKLASISVQLKNELVDKQTTFATDEMGRTLFNDRQLMDWTMQKAKSQQDLLNYEQSVNQMSQLRMGMLKQSKAVLEQAMTEGSDTYNQVQGIAAKQAIQAAYHALDMKIKQEAAKQASRAGLFAGVGAVIGAVVGAYVSGGTGAAAGATLGAGAGTALAGATQSKNDTLGPAPQVQ